jgi:hypothetical protein
LELLTVETYRDGASLVALKDGQVVGASFNKVQTVPQPDEAGFFADFKDKKCKTNRAKEYIDCMIRVSISLIFLSFFFFFHSGIGVRFEESFSCVVKRANYFN